MNAASEGTGRGRAVALWLAGLYAVVALPAALSGVPPGPEAITGSVVLAIGLIALSVIDLETMRLPDALTLPLAMSGLALAFWAGWAPTWEWRLAAAAGAYLIILMVAHIYEYARGRAGIGLGDAKLLAVGGAWLGPDGVPATLLYACAAGLIYAALRSLNGKPVQHDERLAFGPFLAAAVWLVWLYGPLV